VDDILSQVVRMEFFGSKTSPCKNPADKSLNGKFYTVPVKFMFKDRKSAQTAADILHDFMGINSTTPYHRSLRAAMNKVITKAKEENPGYQAKTNLDLNGKSLKCFIRPDIKPPGRWVPHGDSVPLSYADMDPSSSNVRNNVSQNPNFSSPAGQRQKTRAVDNRTPTGNPSKEDGNHSDSSSMETESSLTTDSGKEKSEEQLMKELKEVNKDAGPDSEILLVGERTDFEELKRSGTIAEIKSNLDLIPIERLLVGGFADNLEDDIFMETLVNNLKNDCVSYQTFISRTIKNTISSSICQLDNLKQDHRTNQDAIFELEKKLNRIQDRKTRSKLEGSPK
jgi:hypothetical protein